MEFDGKVVVVTGGAHGLGEALCRTFAADGATVVVADLHVETAQSLAGELDGMSIAADVGREADVEALVKATESAYGRLDVFFSNVGVGVGGHPWTADETWERVWQVNVMSNVYAARHALPGMLARGEGYLASTASSNGITTSTSDLIYAATKHAQVAVAEWLAMVYGTRGIRVSVLCPRWMWTEMTRRATAGGDPPPWLQMAMVDGVTAEEAAAITIDALRREQFLITTGEDTIRDFRQKADDFDAWIRRLQTWHDELQPDIGPAGPA
jgi:NAD(P)-dependent dehydrogenase (short-subunit alcohol dehydrogenase family)